MKNRLNSNNKVPNKELIIFLMSTFFYTNMTSMVNNFRQAYLINVLQLGSSTVSLINMICAVACFALSFFYAMIVDRPPQNSKGKFKPFVKMATIPLGIIAVLMFITPRFPLPIMVAYLCIVTILNGAASYFAGTVNTIAYVITPSNVEREKILSYRGVSNAIAGSAPWVIVLVIGLLRKPGIIKTEEMMYIVSAVLCSVVGTVTMVLGMRVVKERTVYGDKKENPLLGYKDIIKNKYALLVVTSELIMNIRNISGYLGIFLATALLGDPSKYILFGLPTDIGAFIGMLIVNVLLKRFNSKQIYICSGVYSLFANIGAFYTGVLFFRNPGNFSFEAAFFGFLFLIGMQYGASNLLPSMFQADILEDLEVKTHKRLDASLGFFIGIGGTVSNAIVSTVAPLILYGKNSLIHYLPPVLRTVEGVTKTIYLTQTYHSKVMMLVFYTIFNGSFMLFAGIPFLFYKLTGKERSRVHAEVLAYRASIAENDTGNKVEVPENQ